MTRLFIVTAIFCLAVPTALAAPPAGQSPGGSAPNPSQLCAEQLRTMGAVNFQALYAPNGNSKNARGKCVSRQAQVLDTAAANAAKTCKLERGVSETSISAFETRYGTPPNYKNALGKCVSSLANGTVEAQQDATLNAAKKCKTMRATSRAAFDTAYGTKKNAFGKCVAKEKQQG